MNEQLQDFYAEFLARANDALRANRLDDPAGRERIRAVAHQLRGSGALYGLPQVSAAGTRLEQVISTDEAPLALKELRKCLAAVLTPSTEGFLREASSEQPWRAALVVDDDPAIRVVVRLALERSGAGWRVQTAATGDEALALLEKERFAVALLDRELPDGPGERVLSWIRAHTPATPAVFLTACDDCRMVQDLRDAGAAGVVCKPFDPAELTAELDRLLG